MAAAKKTRRIYKAVLLMAVPLFALLSCGTKYDLNDEGDNNRNYGKDISGTIIFNNNSDYNVSIYQDNFSGLVLVERDKFPPGASFAVKVNPSNNYGTGSMFSFVYWKRIMRNEDTGNGDVWTGKSLDYSDQTSKNIETGKEYTIRVPQPSVANFTESFFKIFNASNSPFELKNIGTIYRQAGNGEFQVSAGTWGVYKIEAGNIEGLYIDTGAKPNSNLPNFTVERGYIYTFEFNGNGVVKTAEEPI